MIDVEHVFFKYSVCSSDNHFSTLDVRSATFKTKCTNKDLEKMLSAQGCLKYF